MSGQPPKIEGRLRRIARAALAALVFTASLIATARVLDRWLPPVEVPVIDEKLAYLHDHRDEFDTLFIGSSRTYNQIAPKVFDAETASAGLSTMSFNFGVSAMFPPEDGYVAEKLFAIPQKKLRRVFIEVSFFRDNWTGMEPESTRALHWHDGTRLGEIFHEEMAGQRRIAYLGTHLRLHMRRLLNAGRGATLAARQSLGTKQVFDWTRLGGGYRGGLIPASRKDLPPLPLEEFHRRLAEVRIQPIPRRPLSDSQRSNLNRILRLVRAAGAEPILFIAPGVVANRGYLPEEPDLPVFDFTEVEKWPQLYRAETRIDDSHFDREGSLLFTREFARLLVAHEKAKAAH